MDPTKLTGIKDWIPPKTVKGLRSLLGFGNFYQRFIGNYVEIAKPLNELTKKMKIFEWSQECQTAFEKLNKKFLEKPVLTIPDPSKQFFIKSDASKWATGAVLEQLNNNRDLKPCGYISHSLTATERNYDIYNREMLGITRALQTWRHFLVVFAGPVLWTEKIHRTKLNRTVVRSIFQLRLPKFGVILVASCLISKIIQNCSKTG